MINWKNNWHINVMCDCERCKGKAMAEVMPVSRVDIEQAVNVALREVSGKKIMLSQITNEVSTRVFDLLLFKKVVKDETKV